MIALVEAERLRKCFGSIVAVDDISLSVRKGEVLGFLGPNGAGKSTTMKMIAGFLEPDRGCTVIAGIDMRADPKAAKAKLGYLPEGAPAYSDMTPKSFLGFIADIRGYAGGERQSRISAAAEKAGLESVWEQRIETLSKGFKRRVGIAQAILHDPPVLVMDEPTDGLDPNQKHHVRDLIRQMSRDKAIIVSTHILEEVEAVCTRAVIIDMGLIVADGTAEDLQRRAPYHHAVSIRLGTAAADRARQVLEGLNSIARIDTVGIANGAVQLRAIPKTDASIAPEVAALLREKGIDAEEIFVERGRLEDVFRQITTGEGRKRHA